MWCEFAFFPMYIFTDDKLYIFMISGAKASVKLSLFELAITFCYKGLAVSFCSLQLTACMLKRSVN